MIKGTRDCAMVDDFVISSCLVVAVVCCCSCSSSFLEDMRQDCFNHIFSHLLALTFFFSLNIVVANAAALGTVGFSD